MGLEFSGKLEKEINNLEGEFLLSQISAEKSIKDIRFEVNPLILKAKFEDHTLNEFEEDLEIKINKKEVYIVFHSGTKKQTERILSAFKTALKKLNLEVQLEEE